MNRLEPILIRTRQEVSRRQARQPVAELERRVLERGESGERRPFAGALSRPGLSLIAEHKRRSPSAGMIRPGSELEAIVGCYERAGAAALSILTEEANFGGSLADLAAARASSSLPILRKDFIVDPYQVLESAAAGADAILLIVAALGRRELEGLHDQARALGLAALVEVHDADELEVALAAGAEIVGINNRDLTTLEVDTRRALALAPRLPQDVLAVAESGFRDRAELEAAEAAGIDAVLIGEALMRSDDVEAACRALTLL